MSVDLSVQQEPTVSVITTVPMAANGGEMDALLLGRIGKRNSNICHMLSHQFLEIITIEIKTAFDIKKQHIVKEEEDIKKQLLTDCKKSYQFHYIWEINGAWLLRIIPLAQLLDLDKRQHLNIY
ncbi:hypothetical protein GQX74_007423 [Glossina fuscipes]|nr:hypothetical protein GQX74_007423 [Glossina fuscipes]